MQRNEANQEARLKNEAPAWYDEEETSCNAYPQEYKKFLQKQWLFNSRRSENQNDECKSKCINPETGKCTLTLCFFAMKFTSVCACREARHSSHSSFHNGTGCSLGSSDGSGGSQMARKVFLLNANSRSQQTLQHQGSRQRCMQRGGIHDNFPLGSGAHQPRQNWCRLS